MDFEWDQRKNNKNLIKHGFDFEHAITAFDDFFGRVEIDSKHSNLGEKREILIGESDIGVLVVIFTIRKPGNIYRIISARKASRRERRLYEESKRI